MFDVIDDMLKAVIWLLIIFVPLGLWKLIEIIIWIVKHVSISW